MKEYFLGFFNGVLVWIIFGCFMAKYYITGIILCFVLVASIALVYDIIPMIKRNREAREMENIINGARVQINKEFRGEKL